MVLEGHSIGDIMSNPLEQDDDGNYIVRIGHSPDPDDAFMFHAMTNNKFPTPGYHFVHEPQDIETLNHRAMNQKPRFLQFQFTPFLISPSTTV